MRLARINLSTAKNPEHEYRNRREDCHPPTEVCHGMPLFPSSSKALTQVKARYGFALYQGTAFSRAVYVRAMIGL
jgi:hypothetical protein